MTLIPPSGTGYSADRLTTLSSSPTPFAYFQNKEQSRCHGETATCLQEAISNTGPITLTEAQLMETQKIVDQRAACCAAPDPVRFG